MKLHTDRVEIERSGVDTEVEFSIKTTAKAFDILSSGLYTDNIRAVVRELSCNAYDAHVAAGKADEPFEIHVPNRLEPFFSVKDFGTGLSDEQVMTLYTTYFDSTKTDSNDFIGALGLGSKSPFSYVKAFEVIARYDGVRRVYSIFINEDGVPTIARLGEPIATDEHNGLEVKMTVNENDFYKFREKIASALKWFPTKPTVLGEAHFQFDKPPATDMQGEGWYIHKEGWRKGTMVAVQGNVEYRVDIGQLEELNDSVRSFLKQVNVIGFFDIGELEVAASREEIKYDKRSRAALITKIESIHRAALVKIEEEADKHDSFWDAVIALNHLSESMFNDASALREFVGISENETLKRYSTSRGSLVLGEHFGHDVYMYVWSRRGITLKRTKLNPNSRITPYSGTAIVHNDLRTGGVQRLTKWMHAKNKTTAIVIVEHKNPLRFKTVTNKKTGEESTKSSPMGPRAVVATRKTLLEALGEPKLVVVSQDTTKVKRNPTQRMKSIYQYGDYNHNDYRADTITWNRAGEDEEFDFDAGGFYFYLSRRTIMWGEKEISWEASDVEDNFKSIFTVLNHYHELEGDDKYTMANLYGVGALDIKKFQKHDDWINVFDLFAETFDTYTKAAELNARWKRTPNVLGLLKVIKVDDFNDRVAKLDVNSPFRKLVDVLTTAHKEVRDAHLPGTDFVAYFDARWGEGAVHPSDPKPFIERDTLKNAYPMLEYIGELSYSSWNRTNMDTVFDYINLIDRS